MLEKHLKTLQEVRSGKTPWSEFAYAPQTDGKNLVFDENSGKRYPLLLSLQYNRQPGDETLLAYLFEQEIAHHKEADVSSESDALKLVAYLLSRFRNPAHVPLFWQAKRANFDTRMGFDCEFILSAGLEPTYAFLTKAEFQGKAELLEDIGKAPADCYLEDEEIEEWHGYMNGYFPDVLVLNSLEEEIQMAVELGEKEVLREKISVWKKGKSNWSAQECSTLYWWEKSTGNLKGQIWAKEKELELVQQPWDKASCLLRLTELHLSLGDGEAAWEQIQQAHSPLAQVKNWQGVGLGRSFLEFTFEVVLKVYAMNQIMAHMAYEWGISNVSSLESFHLNLLEKGANAATLMADPDSADRFRDTFQAKRAQLDRLLEMKEANDQ